MGLSERIRYVRESVGMNQAEFPRALGCTQAFISFLESGKKKASKAWLFQVSWKFGVDKDWLESGQGCVRSTPREELIGASWLLLDNEVDETLQFIRRLRSSESRPGVARPPISLCGL